MHEGGALGAIGSTGLLGHTVGKASPLAGKYLDIVSQRVNNGGAIPDSLHNNFIPIATVNEIVNAYGDVTSGDSARQIRGAASVLKSTKTAAEYGVMASQGTGKTSATGATMVPGVGRGDIIKRKGQDIKMPELTSLDVIAGMAGITPPVVADAYEAMTEEKKRAAANDKMFSQLVSRAVKASYMTKDSPERKDAYASVEADLKAWNEKAKKAGRPTDLILPVTLMQGAKMERAAQGSGAFNLRRTQKLGRPEAIEALNEVAPENRPTKE